MFVRTKAGADRLVEKLRRHDVDAVAIHGDKGQAQRERALARFDAGKVKTLVATDVAARGLDVDDITHVINFDPPEEPDVYTHRVGRTGRAGRGGVGITLVLPEQQADVSRVARMQGQVEALRGGRHEAREAEARLHVAARGGRRSGRAASGSPRSRPRRCARSSRSSKARAATEVVAAIKKAREFGDLSENFEYHAAKNEQGLLEARIRTLRARLDGAEIVEQAPADEVGVGSVVDIEGDGGQTMTVEISAVGGAGTVSPTSPLGSALLGRKVGDTVDVAGAQRAPGARRSPTSTRMAVTTSVVVATRPKQRNLGRLSEIAQVAVRHGFGYLVEGRAASGSRARGHARAGGTCATCSTSSARRS